MPEGRKNAMSATSAPTSATARAMEKLRMSRPPGGAVRGQRGVRDDVPGVRARRVEGRADRAQHVGQVAMERGDEVRALRKHAGRLRTVDLAIDDLHVTLAAQRVERPLRADVDAGLAWALLHRLGHANLSGRFAVRLAGAAMGEKNGHHDVLAGPRGSGEYVLDLAEDTVAVAPDECAHVVGLDLEPGVVETSDRLEDHRHVAVGHRMERDARAEERRRFGLRVLGFGSHL